jgi:hypothetical protein
MKSIIKRWGNKPDPEEFMDLYGFNISGSKYFKKEKKREED